MNWLPDYEDLAKPPTVYQAPEEEEELTPEEIREEIFYSHTRYRPDTTSYQQHAAVDICRFQDGQHYGGKNCPHYDIEDEEGMKINPRWTAQMS